MAGQAALDLADAVAGVARGHERPAQADPGQGHQEREAVRLAHADGGAGRRLRLGDLAAELVQGDGEVERHGEAVRMLERLGARHRLPAALDRLVGMAEHPEDPAQVGERADHGIGDVVRRLGEVVPRGAGAVGDALLDALPRCAHLAQPEEYVAERVVRLHEERGLAGPPGQAQEVLGHRARRGQLAAHRVEPAEPDEDGEELRGVPELLA
jgi:hypothetical protein